MPTQTHVSRVVSNLKSPTGGTWAASLTDKTIIVGDNGSGKTAIVQAVELALTGAADDVVGRLAVKDVATLKALAPEGVLTAEAVLSNGETASFSIDKKKTHVSAHKDALVLRDIRAALLAGPAKAREALLDWLSADISQADILGALSEDDATQYQEIAKHKAKAGVPAITLSRVIDHLSSSRRLLQSEIKGAKAVIEQLSQGLDHRPSEADIADAEAAARAAQTQLNTSKAAHADALLTLSRDAAETWCPVCSSEVGAEHLRVVSQYWQRQLTDENNHAAKVVSAHKHLARLQQASEAWARLTTSRRSIQEMERRIENEKALKKRLDEVAIKLLDRAAAAFVLEVDGRLPPDWSFGLNMTGTVRAGLRGPQGTLRPSLSGAEWAAVVAAIGSVVAERRAVPVPVLILEDRAWDPDTLTQVMQALASFAGQVIITTTQGPHTPVTGWSRVTVDLDQAGPADRIVQQLTESGYNVLEGNPERKQLEALGSSV